MYLAGPMIHFLHVYLPTLEPHVQRAALSWLGFGAAVVIVFLIEATRILYYGLRYNVSVSPMCADWRRRQVIADVWPGTVGESRRWMPHGEE